MELTVSPYVDNLYLPQYKTTNYDPSMEMQLLQKKQNDYNTVLNRLSNLQHSALNISMLNLKGQEKLNQYNNELNEMLSEDLGDLSQPDIQAQVASYFNKISNDADLKQRSKMSSHYQNQLDTIERMRSAKDPTKSGYNSVNETVFRKWNGGLEDFMLADDITGFDQKMQSYTPYKDIDQKLVNLTKLLHAEEITTSQPSTQKITVNGKEVEVPTGYTLLESQKGVSKERISKLLQSTLDQDELSQMEILSKYRLLQQNNLQGLSNLYDSYDNWLKTENQYTKNELAKAKAYVEQFNPKNLDSKLSKEEKAQKELEYTVLQKQYQEEEQELNRKLALQTVNSLSKEEWLKKDMTELLPYVNQLTVESYVNGISDSLSWKDQVKKVGTDEAYFADRRLDLMGERLNWDKQMSQARLTLEYEKLREQKEKEAKEKDPNYTSPADIFKSPETIIDSWDRFTNLTKEYQNKTAPIITSKDNKGNPLIDPKNLLDDNWLTQNQGNYEVQLWNAYKAKFFDTAFLDKEKKQPNLNGFNAFKAQVENNDYKNDLVINDIQTLYSRDKTIGDYLTNTSNEIANTINQTSRIEDVTLGEHTLGDYARQHGWTGEGEMTFGLRDGKGGYKSMTWSEIKKEYEEATSSNPIVERLTTNLKDTVISSGINALMPGVITSLSTEIYRTLKEQKPDKDYSIFRDPPFLIMITKAIEQEQKHSKAIQEVYTNKMPQIFQGEQLIALDDKTRTQSIGWINQSIKGSSKDAPVSIDPTQVTNTSIPYGAGEYGGFSITEKEAERLKGIGAKFVTVGGEEKEPQANVWFKVPMRPVEPYDLLLNQVFEKKGVVEQKIEGHNIRITSIKDKPDYMYIYIDGAQSEPKKKKDISIVFAEISNYYKMMNQIQQQPKQ